MLIIFRDTDRQVLMTKLHKLIENLKTYENTHDGMLDTLANYEEEMRQLNEELAQEHKSHIKSSRNSYRSSYRDEDPQQTCRDEYNSILNKISNYKIKNE